MNRVKAYLTRILGISGLLLILLPIATLATNGGSLVSILNLLLGDTPLQVPFSINGKTVYQGDQPTVDLSSINQVRLDLRDVAPAFRVGPESVLFDVSGDCYALGGATQDPLIFEWDLIVGDSGVCQLDLVLESYATGMLQTLAAAVNVSVSGGMPSAFDQLIAEAIDGEVNGGFLLTNIVKATNAPSGADPNQPTFYSFDASKDGVPLKGIMMSSRREFDTRDFTTLNVNAKTFVRSVQGTAVLMGSAVLDSSASTPPADDEVFSILAVAEDAMLPGPAGEPEFVIDGKNRLNVICTAQKIAGFGRFDVARTGTRIASTLVGFSDRTCPNGNFDGESAIYSRFKYLNTPIGRVLVGRGTAHPLKNGRITTTDDQGDANEDYALYFLGIPEQLSSRHEVVELDPGTTMAGDVIELDPFALSKIAKVRRKNGRMFFNQKPDALNSVAVGDILIGAATSRLSDGFIRRVTNFGESDPQFGLFFLETEPAGLNDIFSSGGFTLNRQLTLGDIEEVIQPEYASGRVGDEITRAVPEAAHAQNTSWLAKTVDWFVDSANALNFDVLPFPRRDLGVVFWDEDLNYNTRNDQIRTEGFFDLDAGIDLQFQCKGTLCGSPFFKIAFEFNEDFELATIAKVPTGANRRINSEYTLFSKKFANIWIGPVPIRPIVNLNVSLEGFTEAPVEFGIDQSFTAINGIQLDEGVWTEIKERESTLVASPEPTYVSGNGTTNLTARAAIEGVLKVAGLAGGGIDVGIYNEFTATTPSDPLWTLEAGLNSNASVELDLILTTIESGPIPLFDIPFPTVAVAPDTPPQINSITVDGVAVANGTAPSAIGFGASVGDPLIFKIAPFDAEDGPACCEVRLSSNIDGVLGQKAAGDLTANNVMRFPIEAFSSGQHEITVEVWNTGSHPSTATTQTFTMQGLQTIPLVCDDLDLDAIAHPSLFVSVDETDSVGFEASLSGPSCFPNYTNVIFTRCPYDGVGCFSTTASTTTGSFARETFTFNEAGAYTVQAQYTNANNDVIVSSLAIVAVTEPPVSAVPMGNYGITGLLNNIGSLSSQQQQRFDPLQFIVTPALAADINHDYRVNLFNWTLEDTARFMSPFQQRAGHSYNWLFSDPGATVVVTAMGHAEITADTSGWHRVTATATNDTTGKTESVSKVFYVHEPNSLDFGYQQERFRTDASAIEADAPLP